MKKLINKILASMLTMALIIGMFAGVGLEAKASQYYYTLNVKVIDESGNPVSGVELYLKSTYYSTRGDLAFGTSDSDGKITYQCTGKELNDDEYQLQPVTGSDYTCASPKTVLFDYDDNHEMSIYSIDDQEYSGEEITITVSKQAAEPTISTATTTATSIGKDGGDVTVTITGENLPDTMYYKRQYVGDDGLGGTMNKTVDWSGQAVSATGTATEKTISVPLPAVTSSSYADATAWKISVALTEDGTFKAVSPNTITIEGIEAPVTPEITGVTTSKTSVSAEGEKITVTVTGKNLPESVYSKLYYQYEMSGKVVDSSYGIATLTDLTGTSDTSKTFEIDIPAESEVGGTLGWKIAVSLTMNGTYTKSDAMTIEESSEPTFDKKTLNIIVKDKSGNPVEGVKLVLTCDVGCYILLTETDANGKTSFMTTTQNNTFTLKPAEDSEYECTDPATVIIAKDGEDSYIQKVNNVEFTGQEVVLEVEKAETNISSIEYSITEAKREGEQVTVTVNGKALPEKLYYAVKYKAPTGEDFVEEAVVEKAEGTFAQRTFTVNLPAASAYPTATAWRIGVNTEDPGENHTYQFARKDMFTETNISIAPDTVTEETAKALDDAITEANAEIEKINKDEYTEDSLKAYVDAIEAAKALVDSSDATNTRYLDAIQAIADAKAGLKKIEKPAEPVVKDVKVSGINVTGAPSKKIAAGKKIRLTADVTPANASKKEVVWTSSNSKYATVDANGKVTMKKAGAGKSVVITATAKDGSKVSGSIKISIKKHAVKSIKLKASKTVKAGKKIKVKATVKTTGKSVNKKLKWTVSNSAYAKVTSNGTVKALKAGKGKKVKVTAAATDGSGKKKFVIIKIK